MSLPVLAGIAASKIGNTSYGTPSTVSNNAKVAQDWIKVLIPVLILVILFFFGKKIFGFFGSITGGISDAVSGAAEGLNIKDTKEEKKKKEKAKKNVENLEKDTLKNPFEPNLQRDAQKAGKVVMLVTGATTDDICKKIKGAIGTFYDSPNEILAQFKRLNYKSQVSWIAEKFSDKYGLNLFDWLTDKLDTTEQKAVLLKITEYVNALPLGITNAPKVKRSPVKKRK